MLEFFDQSDRALPVKHNVVQLYAVVSIADYADQQVQHDYQVNQTGQDEDYLLDEADLIDIELDSDGEHVALQQAVVEVLLIRDLKVKEGLCEDGVGKDHQKGIHIGDYLTDHLDQVPRVFEQLEVGDASYSYQQGKADVDLCMENRLFPNQKYEVNLNARVDKNVQVVGEQSEVFGT